MIPVNPIIFLPLLLIPCSVLAVVLASSHTTIMSYRRRTAPRKHTYLAAFFNLSVCVLCMGFSRSYEFVCLGLPGVGGFVVYLACDDRFLANSDWRRDVALAMGHWTMTLVALPWSETVHTRVPNPLSLRRARRSLNRPLRPGGQKPTLGFAHLARRRAEATGFAR